MIYFQWINYSELSAEQLYTILALRAEVFILGQQCLYLDPDGKDRSAIHLLGTEDNQLVAYLRLFPPTEKENDVVFGRVLTAASVRKKGYGKQLMQEMFDYCASHFPSHTISCSAQYYLKNFYESFGLVAYGEKYEEDNILHIAMKKIP